VTGLRYIICVTCAILLLGRLSGVCAAGQADEPTMKAVAFEQVSRFVRWPGEETAVDGASPFVIGLVGQNAVTERVEALYAGRKIRGRSVAVRCITNLADAAVCHLVYVVRTEKETLARIKDLVGDLPVLTVGDLPAGGVGAVLLNLYIHQERLRFEIDEIGFSRAGLELDPLLLKVAKNVNPKKARP